MEEDKSNTITTEIKEVKNETDVPENVQESKVGVKNEENEKINQLESNQTQVASAESNKDNNTNTSTTQENNSTFSPIYSRWKTFSLSKVIENVKKQSETVKEVYQKDLSEFVTTITTESQNLKQKINSMTKKPETDVTTSVDNDNEKEVPKEHERTALYAKRNSSLINKMSTGINSLLNMNKQETPQKKKKIFDRKEALIYELQSDPLTYLIDPLYDPDSSIERIQEFKKFTQSFDLFSYHTEIDKLLDEVEEVKTHHSTIVPARLPEEIFWQRYFFKLKELEDSEKQKKQLVKDVAANIGQEEEIKWDSDDDEKTPEGDIKKEEKPKTTTNLNANSSVPVGDVTTDDKKNEDSDDDWGNWE
ncbi:hypothetical protein BCR36DRAFT_394480 [Piromyces finnis]|uniref:BSD domain-containing protein n=1 Tax=Piromyces finnis TaxID=1754191 RepID=A0A1Y1VM84_9FUNG|nr:hypothetical protein BCR36DRAFT_394480 [Piromyces finnis]|eukprot:ORX60034.1 hypothetical protein BCR36DRAFT_394480 [Piromyces finnis]